MGSATIFDGMLKYFASQEYLARQMVGCSIYEGKGETQFSNNKKKHNEETKKNNLSKNGESNTKGDGTRKGVKCYRCGKPRHIKKNCHVKLKRGNVAEKDGEEEDWGKMRHGGDY